MEFVRNGIVYNTEKSTKIHAAVLHSTLGTLYNMQPHTQTLYLSQHGQLYWITVETGDSSTAPTPKLCDQTEAMAWLDKHNAPRSAYEKIGVEIQEG